MSDMPERIWAAEHCSGEVADRGWIRPEHYAEDLMDSTEYIRADLVAAKDAEIERLRAMVSALKGKVDGLKTRGVA